MHIYVEIYGHRIPTYGLLITIGVILANLIAIICMKRKYKKDCIEDFLWDLFQEIEMPLPARHHFLL